MRGPNNSRRNKNGRQTGSSLVQQFANIPKQIPTDSVILRTSFTVAALTSDGTGLISQSIGASISQASEYSVLASLYREVRLLSFKLDFFFYYPYVNSGTNNGTALIVIGTDMRMNSTTFTLPTQYLDAYNLSDRKLFARTNPRQITFERQVPKNLEYTNIADDCPTLPVPFSGSPGVIQIVSLGNIASITHTTVLLCSATYQLRGRV